MFLRSTGCNLTQKPMLRKKYEFDKDFGVVIQLIGEMDDSIYLIDKVLEDEYLFRLIESDLSKRYKNTTKTGRKSTPIEVILRMLALKHLRGLSYDQTIQNVNESLILRQFCRVYFRTLPNKSTLIRWSHVICQDTLKQLNQRLITIATQLQITQGKKLRTDGTVVATNIHFPTDNTLLVDAVKVTSRFLSQVKAILQDNKNISPALFRNRHRTARRISRQIDSLSKTRNLSGRQRREKAYSKLISVASSCLKQAQKMKTILENINSDDTNNLLQKFVIFLPRIQQVIEQTRRRILNQ
jgi:IS5 family transposase